jgi:hypothetical protein
VDDGHVSAMPLDDPHQHRPGHRLASPVPISRD